MANEVRGGGSIPPALAPTQQAPAVSKKEQAKARLQQPLGQVSAQDAARIAQQAGFHRASKKAKKGFDVGDSSHVPIPLPDDETDTETWTAERLEGAQENLALASAQFGELAKAAVPEPMAEAITASSFRPTDEGVRKLQELAERPPPEPSSFEELTTSVKNLFNIELSDETPVAHRLLVTGLVVAGEAELIEVDKGRVNDQKLAAGVQRVAERSNQAVGEAQKMSKGVSRELNLQRTFVFKR